MTPSKALGRVRVGSSPPPWGSRISPRYPERPWKEGSGLLRNRVEAHVPRFRPRFDEAHEPGLERPREDRFQDRPKLDEIIRRREVQRRAHQSRADQLPALDQMGQIGALELRQQTFCRTRSIWRASVARLSARRLRRGRILPLAGSFLAGLRGAVIA